MGTLDGEMSEGNAGWGGNGRRCWMQMLDREVSSFLPPFTVYFTFLVKNNPEYLPSFPLR